MGLSAKLWLELLQLYSRWSIVVWCRKVCGLHQATQGLNLFAWEKRSARIVEEFFRATAAWIFSSIYKVRLIGRGAPNKNKEKCERPPGYTLTVDVWKSCPSHPIRWLVPTARMALYGLVSYDSPSPLSWQRLCFLIYRFKQKDMRTCEISCGASRRCFHFNGSPKIRVFLLLTLELRSFEALQVDIRSFEAFEAFEASDPVRAATCL